MSVHLNDNHDFTAIPLAQVPDAQGQAALLLAESMLYALIEAKALTRAQAVESVRTAMEVKAEVAEAQNEPNKVLQESLALLSRMCRGLENEPSRP